MSKAKGSLVTLILTEAYLDTGWVLSIHYAGIICKGAWTYILWCCRFFKTFGSFLLMEAHGKAPLYRATVFSKATSGKALSGRYYSL